jgi:sialate O-acetylesterase
MALRPQTHALISLMNPIISGGVLSLLLATIASADVRLPAIFSDHMVLQRDTAVPVWGWADPGETVTVTCAGQTQTATAGADGSWSLKLANLTAAEPTTLTVAGSNTITIQDVLVGEVWLGSGQSNMAMTVNRAKDYPQEQAAATWPKLRVFTEKSSYATTPGRESIGTWEVCTPETVGTFSATLYFFGRELHRELGVPVGLIVSSVGGTPIQAWIDSDALRAAESAKPFLALLEAAKVEATSPAARKTYEAQLAKWQAAQANPDPSSAGRARRLRKPMDPETIVQRRLSTGGLFNGKISPLIPYAIRGITWYQGEANATTEQAPHYGELLSLLITDWRTRWGSELPFAWVQLAGYDRPGTDWPLIREEMTQPLALPRTGMAVAIDIGDAQDIHPKNKQEVGRRLAAWALGDVYGKDVATSGPRFAGSEIRKSEVILRFTHVDGGLKATGDGLKGFEIAGADGAWKPAQARIEGETIAVFNPEVPAPTAARYAWAGFPEANLCNGAGLPASPFRTKP